MVETTISLVKTYQVGGQSPILVFTIPKEIRKRFRLIKGIKFYVKVDGKGRIIYEPLEKVSTKRNE